MERWSLASHTGPAHSALILAPCGEARRSEEHQSHDHEASICAPEEQKEA